MFPLHHPIRLFVLLALLGVTVLCSGCPKNSASTESSGEAEVVPKSRFSGTTKTFVDTLVTSSVIGYAADDTGAAVIYEELKFSEDGSFSARTTIRLGDEPYECTETGTWTLDGGKADSATSGAVTFELKKTDCAGREAPKTWRGRINIRGTDIEIAEI